MKKRTIAEVQLENAKNGRKKQIKHYKYENGGSPTCLKHFN